MTAVAIVIIVSVAAAVGIDRHERRAEADRHHRAEHRRILDELDKHRP
jgi:hypothetical protein